MTRARVTEDDAARTLLARIRPAWRAALGDRVSDASFNAFLRDNESEVLAALRAWQVRGATPTDPRWFERFNPIAGTPRRQQPGWERAERQAEVLFDNALYVLEQERVDLDIKPALDVLGLTMPWQWEPEYPFDDDFWEEADSAVRPEDVPTLLGTAALGWTLEETGRLLKAVLESSPRGGYRDEKSIKREIADRIWGGPQGRMELVGLDKDTACAFIETHHSALPYCNPRGMMYAIGACLGGQLVAVATAGTPTGRWADDGTCPVDGILELTRIASVGGLTREDRRGRTVPINASSALAARLLDLLPLSGRRGAEGCRFVTYSLESEAATTYLALVAKGLRPVARRRGKKPTGARGSRRSLPHVPKIVWEAGPAARPPAWELLPEEKRAGAQRAFEVFSERDVSP
jgi:hypothetical protein